MAIGTRIVVALATAILWAAAAGAARPGTQCDASIAHSPRCNNISNSKNQIKAGTGCENAVVAAGYNRDCINPRFDWNIESSAMRADCFCNNKGPSEIYWDCFYQVVNQCARTHEHLEDINRTYSTNPPIMRRTGHVSNQYLGRGPPDHPHYLFMAVPPRDGDAGVHSVTYRQFHHIQKETKER
jgi:hypothetical protein